MTIDNTPLINEEELAAAMQTLGAGFGRILGYYADDGAKSVAAIEEAMRTLSATALVLPAHKLKGESRQFGAERMGDLAETIELTARRCVEDRMMPDELIPDVAMLRGCFEETLDALRRATAGPLRLDRSPARPMFGRRAPR
jgi:HPt (histidine-containing phosphotransfer) domain-containing protein